MNEDLGLCKDDKGKEAHVVGCLLLEVRNVFIISQVSFLAMRSWAHNIKWYKNKMSMELGHLPLHLNYFNQAIGIVDSS